jgi:O-antigen/teichoic acid export membrane protein
MMDPRLRVAKNTAALLILRLVVPLLSMAVVLAVSRLLGTEGLGRYTLAFSFLYFFNTLAPLGLYTLITREGARDPVQLEGMLANALTLTTVASLVLTAMMIGLSFALHYDADTRSALILVSLAILPCTVGTLLDGAFTALERMEFMTITAGVESLFKVGVGVAVLFFGYGLDAVLIAAVVARLLACAVSIWLLERTNVRVRWAMDREIVRSLAREAPTFLLISVFAAIYWRIDILMLSWLCEIEDVGLYGAAWRLLELAIVVPQSFCQSLYPQMASAIRSEAGTLGWLNRTAGRYLLVLSVPAAVCTTILAGPLLALLYGEPFRAAGSTLAVLMWTVVPYGWVRYHAYVLLAADRQRTALAFNVLMAVVNVGLDLIFIPAYRYLGAAVATLISVAFYACAQQVYLSRHLPGHAAPVRFPPGMITATVAMGVCLWVLRDAPVAVPLALSPLLYMVTLLASGGLTADELKVLRVDRVLKRFGFNPGNGA